MSKFSMRHLRYFDALSRMQSFRKAAEDCAISQPALSMQIKELEAIVGSPLVERGGGSVRLTSLGEVFAIRVRRILKEVDELDDYVRAGQSPLAGRLRIGVIPTVAPYLLPDVIKTLTQRFPSLDIRPREAVTKLLIEDLLDSRLDMAIAALPVSEPSLREFSLFEEEFILVRPEADRHKPAPNALGLKEMRLLLLEEGHCFRDQALSFCAISDPEGRDLMEGSSMTTLVQMVGAGIGVTLIPEMSIDIEARSAPVSLTRLLEPRPKRSIGLIWRKSNPLEEQFMDIASIVRLLGRTKYAQNLHTDLAS
ncbi:MAG: LysR substrate-binding domain-containing protein [Pseudomonadota bacterium]